MPPSVKRALQKAKGGREWGEYLMELYTENIRLKQEKAHEQLRELLSEEDLKRIEESSREFRRSFRIGEGRI